MEKLTEIKAGQTGRGLLIEHDGELSINQSELKVINESIESGSVDGYCPNPFILPAVFQRYGVENANGRIYPEDILKREVEKYQERIRNHQAIAELNHPSDSVIDLSRVAISVVELHWIGNTLVGKIKIETSPGFRKYGIISCRGDETANLLLNGIKIGLSSRGLGSVEKKSDGTLIVGNDFELVCFDVVADPSTRNAWIVDGETIPSQYIDYTPKKKEPKNESVFDALSKFDSWLR